jgi:hypothetical protein
MGFLFSQLPLPVVAVVALEETAATEVLETVEPVVLVKVLQ